MAEYRETLMELFQRIREINENLKLENPVPTGEELLRNLASDIVSDKKVIKDYLNVLTESHFLFPISMVESDENMMIDGITGYVVAEVGIVSKLKEKYKTLLEGAYEHQFYQRKHYVHILRELITESRRFNNTPLGRCLNVAHMLEQFAQIFAGEFNEYSESWKNNRLEEVLSAREYAKKGKPENASAGGPDAEPASPPPLENEFGVDPGGMIEEIEGAPAGEDFDLDEFQAPAAPARSAPTSTINKQPVRATDNPEYMKIQEMNRSGNWGQAVDKYGVQFLLRIHFRKYEFEKVRMLLKSHKIAREEDLRYVRDTLRLMESRTGQDPELIKHMAKMTELRRMAQLRLNQIHLLKKKT